MNEETQLIETIRERDVDLILLEELNTNNHFTNWFISQLELPELTKTMGAWRSITGYGQGETDLLLSYHSTDKTIFVLIENKLDANFQERQFERYQLRGGQYKLESKCTEYFPILFAPKQYAEGQNDFEKYITYEDLRDYFEFDGNRRQLYKASLLNIAIEKSKRGYQPINCEPVFNFVQSYWKYREDHFPEFIMKKPAIVPADSDWIQLRKDDLKNIVLFHKLGKGFIDATFINYPAETEFRIKEILPAHYMFVKHKSGRFSLRQKIGSIDKMLNFDKQLENVRVGLEKVKEVSEWIKANLK